MTLPGPYLLTRAMYVPRLTRAVYPTKEDLGEDVVRVLREELAELVAEGADFIQFDEPVLTELVFAPGQTRTFMCAALAARKDPAEELELAVSLINRVVDGFDGRRAPGCTSAAATGAAMNPHCSAAVTGRWRRTSSGSMSSNWCSSTLPSGPATSLAFGDKELGLGVVNPRTDDHRSADAIVAVVQNALRFYPAASRMFLNPDCGFGTFSNRPVNVAAVAEGKLRAIASAARRLRS